MAELSGAEDEFGARFQQIAQDKKVNKYWLVQMAQHRRSYSLLTCGQKGVGGVRVKLTFRRRSRCRVPPPAASESEGHSSLMGDVSNGSSEIATQSRASRMIVSSSVENTTTGKVKVCHVGGEEACKSLATECNKCVCVCCEKQISSC